ncbi:MULTISPECIES: hypothetical protein [unclassified Brevundimonas]|uniref:hypothetical protein n=1 Tax=unclassified Brevundimonas TaxID=2622653 RepID=UPI0025B80FDC|nr:MULTISPECIES: hypothetical protein [unclassified Brevundimonas]
MSNLTRYVCALAAAIVMIAAQTYGVFDAPHRFEDAVKFPELRAELSLHQHANEHASETQNDNSESPDKAPPGHHHHHAGTDIHLAIVNTGTAKPALSIVSARLSPAHDAVPPGTMLDAPYQPPRTSV